jgi:DNA mismatch endonuclease (patch repair protein)
LIRDQTGSRYNSSGVFDAGLESLPQIKMDKLSAESRSWNMSRIRGRDTVQEKRVRSLLHRLGFRFSLQNRELPGCPDIVLKGRKTAIFVHGCFWHRHKGCKNAVLPKTRAEFWLSKLHGNVERDKRNLIALKRQGWRVLTIWECEIKQEMQLSERLLAELSIEQDD